MEHRLIDYLANNCKGGTVVIKRLVTDAKAGSVPEPKDQAALASFIQERYEVLPTPASTHARQVFRLYRGWKHYVDAH